MNILKRKGTACTLIGTKEDGTRKFVCQFDGSKVFEVDVDTSGKLHIDAKYVLISQEEYKKIYDELKRQSPSGVV
jgi:hypothetical protein